MSAFAVNKHLHYYAMFRNHRPICIMLMSVVLKCAILPICTSHNSSCMRVNKNVHNTFFTENCLKLTIQLTVVLTTSKFSTLYSIIHNISAADISDDYRGLVGWLMFRKSFNIIYNCIFTLHS